MARIPVVYDINVLIDAVTSRSADFYTWPQLPAKTTNPYADCLGVVNDNHDFALWLSPHILRNVERVLVEAYGYDVALAREYLTVLEAIAVESGGGIVDPPRVAHVNPDHEDNLILDLAVHSGAMLVVSSDSHLLDMPTWRSTAVIHPRDFASRVDAKRRHEHTRPRTPSTTETMRQTAARPAQHPAARRRPSTRGRAPVTFAETPPAPDEPEL